MGELLDFLTTHEERFFKGRLGALYSDFRHLRTTNPDGYSANISAWQKALTDATRKGYIPSRGNAVDILVITVSDDLLRALETKEWGRPLSLGTVFNDMKYKKELIPLKEFLDSKTGIYQRPRVATQLFYWSLRQLGFAGSASSSEDGEDRISMGRYVVLANVEEVAREASDRMATKTTRVERIYSKDLFREELKSCLSSESNTTAQLSPTDFDIFLKYLSRDKQMIAYDGHTVKLKPPSATEKESPEITNEDTAIASLKNLVTELRTRIEALTVRVDYLSQGARDAVAKKNIVSARSILRSKKLAETMLEKRTGTLAQLEEVLASIEQAADQVEFMHVMEISTGVLRGLNKEVGGVERVDRVVDQLREQMSEVDEVGEVMSEVGKERVDELEVSDELEVMEREERERVDAAERAERERRAKVEREKMKERERKEAEETKRRLDALPTVGEKEEEVGNKDAGRPVGASLKRFSLETQGS